jgi:hypothetical protein
MLKLFGKISNMEYKSFVRKKLKVIPYHKNVNDWGTRNLVQNEDIIYSVSKWVSPKRSRSYPYARVYDTLSACSGKTVTIIPIVKDEGINGDMDYLQWDTISLMSLLNVYAIIGYYSDAIKNPRRENKITKQKLDTKFVKGLMAKLLDYHSSALHWNLNQLKPENLDRLMRLVIENYRNISTKTDVTLHNEKNLDSFRRRIISDYESFLKFSRDKAQKAQQREIHTIQPKELLGTGEKASIEIENYLGGLYYFTIDEVIITEEKYRLIESKHTRSALLPSKDDIKDGLLKMIVYSNIDELYDITIKDEAFKIEFTPVIRLTSPKLIGKITSEKSQSDISSFIQQNSFKKSQIQIINKLFKEAKTNKFEAIIEYGEKK